MLVVCSHDSCCLCYCSDKLYDLNTLWLRSYDLIICWVNMLAQTVKNPPAMQKIQVWSLGLEDPLEKGTATHARILAWRIHGQRSLLGYRVWCYREPDTTWGLTYTCHTEYLPIHKINWSYATKASLTVITSPLFIIIIESTRNLRVYLYHKRQVVIV